MPKAVSAPSEPPDDQAGNPFVYDFLYQDIRRVGSYLAQFVPSGHLQSTKQTTSTEEAEQSESGASASANAVIARAQGQFSDRVSSGLKDSMEQTYDPIWINVVDLLQLLENRRMIQRDLSKARIGQFILVSGVLGILDLALLQRIWGVSMFRDVAEQALTKNLAAIPSVSNILSSQSHKAKHDAERQAKAEALKKSKGMMDLIQSLPHTVQARIATNNGNLIYAALQQDGLTTSSTDFGLKNGLSVIGDWGMLGILDSFPDKDADDDAENIARSLGISGNPFTAILNSMMPLVRQLGRPATAFGMTPLLIFREVTA